MVVYMATRTQIYLTDEQRARLRDEANRQGRAMSQLIREAVDAYLSSEDDLDSTFGVLPEIGRKVPGRTEWETRGRPAR